MFGGRSTFWAVTLIGCAAMTAIFLWLPRVGRGSAGGIAAEFGVLARPRVLMALSLTLCLSGAAFCVFTFIAPLLAEIASIAPSAPLAAAMMFCWGFCFYFPAIGIQIMVVNAARGAPNLVSTLVQSGFNIGNAIGPSIGAAALTKGFGYADLPWIAGAMTLLGAGAALRSAAPETSLRNARETENVVT
jgi:DHA1 family inner membrane transport protein